MALLVLYFSFTLFISFLCSLMESVLLSTSPIFVKINENSPKKGVRKLVKFKNNVDKSLSAILSLNNTFRFNGGWQLELGGLMQTKGYSQNMYMKDVYFNLSAAVQKTLLKDNSLVLRLEGSDLTHTAKTNVDSDFGNHTMTQYNVMDFQKVKFSIRYTFNAAQSKYRGTGAGSDQKSRM